MINYNATDSPDYPVHVFGKHTRCDVDLEYLHRNDVMVDHKSRGLKCIVLHALDVD